MIKPLLLALITACTTTAAFAEEGGSITLDIGGGSHTFPLWNDQSDWSGSETYGSVNIYALPTDDATRQKFGTVTLGFTYSGSGADAPEASVAQMVDGKRVVVFAQGKPEKGGLVVTLNSVTVDGDELSISGTLAAQMGPSNNYGRDIDLSAPLGVTGTFDVTLGPV